MERRIFILAGALPLIAAFGALIVGLGLVVFGDNGSDAAQGSTASPAASAAPKATSASTDHEQTGNGWLGVAAKTVDGGVEVTDVTSGSPADSAGIATHDKITKVDGEAMDSFEALASLIRTHSPGDKVTITFEHDGDTKDVDVTLSSRPGTSTPPDIGGLLPDLGGILDGFSLDQLIGGQLQYLDADGNTVTLSADAGKITSVSTDSISVHPPKGDDKTFDLTSDAHVPDNLSVGDQVIVVSKDNKVAAVISTDVSKLLPFLGGEIPQLDPNLPHNLFPNGILPHCTFDTNGLNCNFEATPTPAPKNSSSES